MQCCKSNYVYAHILCLILSIGTLECMADSFLPSHLTCVWWHFNQPEFEDFQIDFEIHEDIPDKPGIFLQFYQGKIGDTGFYFGFQTNINKPDIIKGRSRGIIFSRWGTRDLKNVRPISGSWVQSAGYEGDFVGIRRKYEWTNHRYRFRLTRIDTDPEGVWYGLFILDYNLGREDYAGALRFPRQGTGYPKIRDGGGTWTEVYNYAKSPADLPRLNMTINGAYADFRKTKAQHAVSDYYNVDNTDIFCEPDSKRIHVFLGKGVTRKHPKGRLF